MENDRTVSSQEAFGRRSFLRKSTVFTAGTVGLSAGIVTADRNENIESLKDPDSITPIFAFHRTGYDSISSQEDLRKQTEREGVYPSLHLWPESVSDEFRSIEPAIVAIDSLSYTPLQSESTDFTVYHWFGMPDNPFKLKGENGLYIVSADLHQELLRYQAYPETVSDNGKETKAVLSGIKKHYEKQIGGPYGTNINYLVDVDELDTYFDKERREAMVSFFGLGMVPAAYLIGESAIMKKPISRRKALGLGVASLLGFGNATRVLGYYYGNNDDYAYNPLYAPVSTIPEIYEHGKKTLPYVNFRNAIIATKLQETESLLGFDPKLPMKKTAVMGTAHKLTEPLWYNSDARDRVMLQEFGEIFKILQEEEGVEELNRNKLIATVSSYFGGIAIQEVGEEPEVLSPKDVSENIKLKVATVSPRISLLVEKAAEEVGFVAA